MKREEKTAEEDDEDEEEEEVPEDLKNLDPAVRMRKILIRSFTMMIVGTAIVMIFSDPMVDVLTQFGVLSDIPAF